MAFATYAAMRGLRDAIHRRIESEDETTKDKAACATVITEAFVPARGRAVRNYSARTKRGAFIDLALDPPNQ